jgi:hypothetical protein
MPSPSRSYVLDRWLDGLLDLPEAVLLRTSGLAYRSSSLVRRKAELLARRVLHRLRHQARRPAQASRPPLALATPSAVPVPDRGDRFVLYRIVGNDLYPRHDAGQSLANLQFILEHEPELQGCEKRWLLNRVRDPAKVELLITLLDRHGYGYDLIPFEPEAFAAVPWDWGVLPTRDFLGSAAYRQLLRHQRESYQLALFRHKNNYLMHNNGARNRALELGRQRADWVLPWDGNCYLTAAAWAELRAAVLAQPACDYFWSPMQRISDNRDLLDGSFRADPRDEPQLLFHAQAAEAFNPEFPYGRRPKVELFWRLGLPGLWDQWLDEPWDQPRRPKLTPQPACPRAGWVARLHSGVVDQGCGAAVLSQQSRYSARNLAIKASINQAALAGRPVPRGGSLLGEGMPAKPLLQRQALAARQQLLGWWAWYMGPASRPPQLGGAALLAQLHLVSLASACDLIDPSVDADTLAAMASTLFGAGPQQLRPGIRLLRRRRRDGQLLAGDLCPRGGLQLAYLQDQLAGLDALGRLPGWIQSWQPQFQQWMAAFAATLTPDRHLWQLGWPDRLLPVRYDLMLALVSHHGADPTQPVDALLRAISRLRLIQPGLLPMSQAAEARGLLRLVVHLSERLGVLDPALASELEALTLGLGTAELGPQARLSLPPHWWWPSDQEPTR